MWIRGLNRNFRRNVGRAQLSPVAKMISALRRLGGTLIYAPDTLAGVYVDNVGTTPVTAVADLFGLITDKSYGGQLGVNRVNNGDFSAGTAEWTVPAGWALSSGAMVATSASSSLLQQGAVSTVGRSYEVEFDWTHVGGTLYVRVGAGTAVTFTSSGRKRVILVAASAAGVEFYGGAVSGTLDNIIVREVPGNHATQSAVASKPSLQRVNGRNVIQFDGNNDFFNISAGAIGSDVDVFVGATRTKDKGILLDGIDVGGLKYLGVTDSTNPSVSAVNTIGTAFTAVVDGSVVGSVGSLTRGQLTAAWPLNSAAVVEFRNVNLSAWTALRLGGYPSFELGGSLSALVIVPACSTADRKTIRDGIAALQGRTL